jgi:arylformamidase
MCLTESAVEALVAKGAKIIGIDDLSVDSSSSPDLPVHKLLLKNGILIVENLDLRQAASGRYKIFICPLKVENMDGLPARVIMEKRQYA